ncbi:hypothetical protein M5689_012907 [Euphorbia peplus]|nr:hypothetical protein M5689_012907 [Euphorbia peplus]
MKIIQIVDKINRIATRARWHSTPSNLLAQPPPLHGRSLHQTLPGSQPLRFCSPEAVYTAPIRLQGLQCLDSPFVCNSERNLH